MALKVLTHTKRRNFQNCPRYFMHAHLENLTPRIQKPGRRRGTIFGQTLEFCRQQHDNPNFDLELFCQAFTRARYDELVSTMNVDSYDVPALEVEAVKVGVTAEMYLRHYGYDVRREIEFDLPLLDPIDGSPSTVYKLGGKIDGISKTEKLEDGTKLVTLIEDKFVQGIQRSMIMRLSLDAQVSEYVDAFMQMGWKCKVSYRHTRVTSAKPLPPKQFKTKADYPGETLEEYAQRLRDKMEETPDSYFNEQILEFPTEHMDDYRASRWGIAKQINEATAVFDHYKSDPFWGVLKFPAVAGAFPMNSSRCWEYGGCEFLPLCTKQEGAQDLYVTQRDNPELEEDEGGVTSEYGPSEGTSDSGE